MRLRSTLEFLLASCLAFGTICFGAAPPWAWALLCLFLFAVYGFYLLAGRETPLHRGWWWLAAVPLLGIPLLQLLPLPAGLLHILSPLKAGFLETLSHQGFLSLSTLQNCLTVAPYATFGRMLVLLASFCVFWMARDLFRDSSSTRRMLLFLMALGIAQTVYGLLQYFLQFPHLVPTGLMTPATAASGTYVNRNHFAGLLEMILPLSFALAYLHFNRAILPGIQRARSRIQATFLHPRAPLFALVLFGCVLMSLGIVFSLSRTGIAAMLLTMALLLVLLLLRHGRKKILGLSAAFVLALTGYALWIGLDDVIQRFEILAEKDVVNWDQRYDVWQDTTRLITDFPLAGSGLGTFRQVFFGYNSHPMIALYDQAHNDYLEYAAELGIPACALLVLALGGTLVAGIRLFLKTQDPTRAALALGASGGLFSLLIHSATDFNLHIPGNIAIFALLLGFLSAACRAEAASRSRSAVDAQERDFACPAGAPVV